ncbi:YggT family protein [Cohnella sp. CFH 77786]|uniref:YggT family protein n=1 Tax=Cohnella sp. CFH 77786 TaxID=2662265 RepID=UPI001C60D19A|nr:YggT family protein [Cohnella sp. CFH 77786]MBW5444796.1 YggT family protein [Cohnella sp. CFH 77786]
MNDVTDFIDLLYQVYFYMVLIYVLMSWLPAVRESFVGEFLGKLVEPYLRPFRRLIPPLGGVLDISPIIALLALNFVALGLKAIVGFFTR